MVVSAPLLGSDRCCLTLMPFLDQVARIRGMSSAGVWAEG